jgi:two-component system, response regulator YesN
MDYRIEKVIKLLQKNLNNDISLEKMAEIVNLNPSYFSALFKQESGVSFTFYLKSLRMRYAKIYLRRSFKEIKTIAYDVGYKYVTTFHHVFKKQVGFTPAEFRNKYKRRLMNKALEKHLKNEQ